MTTRLASLLATLALATAAAPAIAQSVRLESIPPSATDPAISGWFAPHLAAYAEDAPARNQLFVFLHGLGGSGGGASHLVTTAAELGFHAIGLTYPNDWSPFVLCGGDSTCAESIRLEILDGVDRTPLVTVPPADAIENRLRAAIHYLHTLHPEEGWLQYLEPGEPEGGDDAIVWDRIVVWGHSQGGGNAGVIAHHHLLARLCTSAPAADGGPGNPAVWWNGGATPGDRSFGFCHTQDALNVKVAFWQAIGMGAFGGVIDVATTPPPFGGTHMLSTSIAPAIAGQYHNSVAMDATTPKDANGQPVYKPVWASMMTSEGAGGGTRGTVWNDVPFATVPTSGGSTTLAMDIYAANTGEGPRPLLVWIHGGGWQGGSHNQVPTMALDLRAAGITVASIGYRLSDEAIFPAQIHDCKGAIRFLRAHAATYGIDPDRIAVWGSSAGGHLAALVATSGNAGALEGSVGGNTTFYSRVLVGATFFGPTDLLQMALDCDMQTIGCTIDHDAPSSGESKLLGVTGRGEGVGWLRANLDNPAPPFPELIALAESANPITHLDPHDPPLYIAHGDVDTTVPLNQSTRLRDAALATTLEHVYVVVPGAGHGFLGSTTNEAAAAWVAERLLTMPVLPADLDGDGSVGGADLAALLASWGGPGSADMDRSGVVDGADLAALLAAWDSTS